MLRGLAAALWLLLACGATAETFQGRTLGLTDGRGDARPAPLVVVLHGFIGSGAGMQRKTHFDALARRDAFVVAYPNGVARRWNAAGDAASPPDDVAYLAALIAALVADGRADPTRVFLAGHSNGGGMAMRMACAHPDLVAGIAVVAMNALSDALCADGAPVPALFMHGAADPIVPTAGVPAARGRSAILSTAETLALWAARNGCGPTPKHTILDSPKAAGVAVITRYTGCRAPLVQVEIAGQGHEWPGAGARARLVQGPAVPHVDAAALGWWFFSSL